MRKVYVTATSAADVLERIKSNFYYPSQKMAKELREDKRISHVPWQLYEVIIQLAPTMERRASRNNRARAGKPPKSTGLLLKGSKDHSSDDYMALANTIMRKGK